MYQKKKSLSHYFRIKKKLQISISNKKNNSCFRIYPISCLIEMSLSKYSNKQGSLQVNRLPKQKAKNISDYMNTINW